MALKGITTTRKQFYDLATLSQTKIDEGFQGEEKGVALDEEVLHRNLSFSVACFDGEKKVSPL